MFLLFFYILYFVIL